MLDDIVDNGGYEDDNAQVVHAPHEANIEPAFAMRFFGVLWLFRCGHKKREYGLHTPFELKRFEP